MNQNKIMTLRQFIISLLILISYAETSSGQHAFPAQENALGLSAGWIKDSIANEIRSTGVAFQHN